MNSKENEIKNSSESGENCTYAYVILLIATFFWGFQAVPLKFLLEEWTSQTITCVRYFLFSGMIFAWLYYKNGTIMPPREAWKPLLLMASCLVLNNTIQIAGIKYTTVVNATLISATNPVNTAVLSFLILKERLSGFAWIGIVLSFAGALTVVSNGDVSVITEARFGFGDVLTYVGVCFWGLYAVVTPRVLKFISVPMATGWSAFIAAWLALALNLVTHQVDVVPLTMTGTLCFLFVLICGGLLSNLLWNRGVEIVGPAIAAMFSNILPLVGILSGYLIMGDEITVAKALGAILVLCGVRLATRKN